jgi:hypothetical protein
VERNSPAKKPQYTSICWIYALSVQRVILRKVTVRGQELGKRQAPIDAGPHQRIMGIEQSGNFRLIHA